MESGQIVVNKADVIRALKDQMQTLDEEVWNLVHQRETIRTRIINIQVNE